MAKNILRFLWMDLWRFKTFSCLFLLPFILWVLLWEQLFFEFLMVINFWSRVLFGIKTNVILIFQKYFVKICSSFQNLLPSDFTGLKLIILNFQCFAFKVRVTSLMLNLMWFIIYSAKLIWFLLLVSQDIFVFFFQAYTTLR